MQLHNGCPQGFWLESVGVHQKPCTGSRNGGHVKKLTGLEVMPSAGDGLRAGILTH